MFDPSWNSAMQQMGFGHAPVDDTPKHDQPEEPRAPSLSGDRMRQCLTELGVTVTGELTQLVPLSRLVHEMIPDRKLIVELRVWLHQEQRRRKEADARVDKLRHKIEQVLCDEPSKNEMLRLLESAMRESEMEYTP